MKTLLLVCLFLPSLAFGQSNLLGDVQAERAKYPATMTRAQVADLLNAVAWKNRADGWGLLKKGAGNSCPLRDVSISCDILIHRGSINHYDVLIDAENTARPTWNLVGPCVLGPSSGCAMENFLAPVQPNGEPGPQPDPDPLPPPVDLGPIISRLNALEASRDAQQRILEGALADLAVARSEANMAQAGVSLLADKVKALEARPIVTGCKASANLGFARIPVSCSVQ